MLHSKYQKITHSENYMTNCLQELKQKLKKNKYFLNKATNSNRKQDTKQLNTKKTPASSKLTSRQLPFEKK